MLGLNPGGERCDLLLVFTNAAPMHRRPSHGSRHSGRHVVAYAFVPPWNCDNRIWPNEYCPGASLRNLGQGRRIEVSPWCRASCDTGLAHRSVDRPPIESPPALRAMQSVLLGQVLFLVYAVWQTSNGRSRFEWDAFLAERYSVWPRCLSWCLRSPTASHSLKQ